MSQGTENGDPLNYYINGSLNLFHEKAAEANPELLGKLDGLCDEVKQHNSDEASQKLVERYVELIRATNITDFNEQNPEIQQWLVDASAYLKE